MESTDQSRLTSLIVQLLHPRLQNHSLRFPRPLLKLLTTHSSHGNESNPLLTIDAYIQTKLRAQQDFFVGRDK